MLSFVLMGTKKPFWNSYLWNHGFKMFSLTLRNWAILSNTVKIHCDSITWNVFSPLLRPFIRKMTSFFKKPLFSLRVITIGSSLQASLMLPVGNISGNIEHSWMEQIDGSAEQYELEENFKGVKGSFKLQCTRINLRHLLSGWWCKSQLEARIQP